jgi:NTP pyrophosphatase (non-canonical NTP hydrolase)
MNDEQNNNIATSDINELTDSIVNFRDKRDWKQFHNPKDLAISLVLESTELLEHFQWKNDKTLEEHILTNIEEIGDELSDILYWILLMSRDLDIDIADSLRKKMKKNELKYPVEKSKGNSKKYNAL